MTYPPFDLEKALAGEPIAFCVRGFATKKAWLHKGFGGKNVDIIEVEDGSVFRFSPTGHDIHGMWQEAPKFEFNYWDFIDKNIVLIEKEFDPDEFSIWCARDSEGLGFDLPLATSLFPDCPVGTIIKRPD